MIDLTAPETAQRLLDVIEHDVVPLTRIGVASGNKIFGAALLRRDTLELVIAETNNETENPLWHGEIHTIKRFFELPAASRPPIGDVLMIATHEPCSLCLSGVAWSGIPEFAYLFSHADSAESFAIPYDIAILKGVYAVPDPDRETAAPGRDLYNRANDYFTSHDLAAGVRALGSTGLNDQVSRLAGIYDELSAVYQEHKLSGDGGAIAHA